MAQLRLGELLISAGAITQEQLDKALELQKGSGKRLGAILIEHEIITELQLIEALQMQLGIDYVDLSKTRIPADMAQMVPKEMATQYQILPIRVDKDILYLAMADPLNFYAQEEVRKTVKKRIIPVVSTGTAIDHAIATLYGNEGAARAIEDMKRGAYESEDVQNMAFVSNQIGEENVTDAPTIRLVNSIIERAVHERASDIHFEPRENDLVVRMRIDGVMRSILTIPRNLQSSVISRIKIMSGLDITERRIPQDGRFNIQNAGKDIDMRVSTLPIVYGEKIVTRLLDKSSGVLNREAIGLTGHDEELFNQFMKIKNGVVLIVGPTGSGKSSTMYTMIGELNTDQVNLVTLEDPVEYNIDGVNQVQINEKTNLTFASGLRSILRQDPDIVAVGEIRDGETADIAMRAAITGHVVISTIHTNDAAGTIERLIDIGVEPYLVAAALKGVISQRLVRRVCPNCKKEYDATDEEKISLGLDPKGTYKFYKGAGCPNCYHTGYYGRIAVFEMLPVNGIIREKILEKNSREEIRKELAKPESGFVSLQQNALRLVLEGTTSVEEVLRVINEN